MTRVSCVGLRPAPNTVLGETLLAGGTLPAVRAPGRDAIGEMAGMAHMVERKLFDGLIAACGRLYMTTQDGCVICLGNRANE